MGCAFVATDVGKQENSPVLGRGEVSGVVEGQFCHEVAGPGSEMRPVESGSDAVAGAGCCDDGVGAGGEHADWVRLRRFDPCRPADFAGEVKVDDGGMAAGGQEEPPPADPGRIPDVRGEVDLVILLVSGVRAEASGRKARSSRRPRLSYPAQPAGCSGL